MSDFTVADVLAWARTKPAGEAYDFTEANSCALAQFGLATGRAHLVGLCSDEIEHLLGRDFLYSLYKPVGVDRFGELVARLEALLPAKPVSDTWTKADAYLTDIEQIAA